MVDFIKGVCAVTGDVYNAAGSTGVSKAIGDAFSTAFGVGFLPGANSSGGKLTVEALADAIVKSVDSVGVPIGATIDWFPHITGVPALPAGFVECNGQTLSDPESPMDGEVIPDLNIGDGTGRYTRGTTGTTGVTQADQNASHSHTITPNPHSHSIKTSGISGSGIGTATHNLGGVLTNTTSLTVDADGGSEARPLTMTARKIMRVK